MQYTDKELFDRAKLLPSYVAMPTGLFIITVRNKADTSDNFDDKFYLYNREQFVMATTCTTNSGKSGLVNPQNSNGTAHIVGDTWHYKTFKKGVHNGKVEALIQGDRYLLLQRDNNKNSKAGDSGYVSIENNRGVNIHPTDYSLESPSTITTIGGWSIGCIALNVSNDFKKLMAEVNKANDLGQDFIPLCILNQF